jgi:hypothetical protein
MAAPEGLHVSHDVDITGDDDRVYLSFIFGSTYPPRVSVGIRNEAGLVRCMELSDHIPTENLRRLKEALDLHLEIHDGDDDE